MIGENFNTPLMYQDLANSTMGPMYMHGIYGGGMYSPLLGDVRLARQLDHDKFQVINKKEKEGTNTMKLAGAALAIILAIGGIGRVRKGIKAAGGFTKYIGNKWDDFICWIKGTKKSKVK